MLCFKVHGIGSGWRPGPPLSAPLKLAMQCLRSSGNGARCSLCSWTRCARKTWSGWNGFHWIAAASFVRRLLARFGTDVASAPPLQNSDVATRLGHVAEPHVAVGSCRNDLDTTHAGGPYVRSGRSQAHQARARRLSASSERARHARLWRRLPQARRYEAIGTWQLGTGYDQDITCGTSARWAALATDSLDVHRYWTKGPKCSTRGFIYASTWGRVWERIDEIGTHLIRVEWVRGHAKMQHVRAATISLWQLQANVVADEQAKKGALLFIQAPRKLSKVTVQGLLCWDGW